MPPGHDRLLRVQSSLTPRDRQLLHWLQDHGVLSTEQVAVALFPSLVAAQRRLLLLTSREVLSRFRPQRWVGGSYPYHYVLGRLGLEVVAADRGKPLPSPALVRRRQARLLVSARLPHRLAVNGFFAQLAGYARTHPERRAALERWWPAAQFHEGIYRPGDSPILLYGTEPHPRPDGYGLWTEDGQTVPFFAEIDRGTESIVVLLKKVSDYDRRARATDWAWPVLFWLPSVVRERHFQEALARPAGSLRVPVATATWSAPAEPAETVERQLASAKSTAPPLSTGESSPAGPVWQLAGEDPEDRFRLSELPYTDADPRTPPGEEPS